MYESFIVPKVCYNIIIYNKKYPIVSKITFTDCTQRPFLPNVIVVPKGALSNSSLLKTVLNICDGNINYLRYTHRQLII